MRGAKKRKKGFKFLIAKAGGPGGSYTVPGKGTTTRSPGGHAKSYEGRGPAPSGTTKTPEKSASEVPTVTVTDSGTTTSGFSSQRAAKQAVRAQKRRAKRVRRIVQETKREPQARSQLPAYKPPKPTKQQKLTGYEPDPSKAVISSTPNPQAKPEVFHGAKTAGAPTRAELQRAAQSGTLRVNDAGAVTTPKIRKVSRKVSQAKKAVAESRTPAPLPGLDAEGQRVARQVLKTGKKLGANRKELLAAAETGLVESSGFHNLHGGDADSEGWRQERTSIFGSDAIHPKRGARNFFTETKQQAGATAGELAANVQRPAEQYRGRYDEVKPEANAIVKAFEQGQADPKALKRLAKVSKQAEKVGLDVGKELGAPHGRPPKQVVTRYKAAFKAAKQVDKLHLPYVWGGGHNSGSVDLGSGVDCSGAVSYVLQKMGVKLPGGVVSGEMGSYLKPGPGAVTVFYNGEHTFMKIGKEYFGTSGSNPGGGAGFIPAEVGDSEVASGAYAVGHVPGLGRKVALQLGVPLGGSQAFPGMTLSPSGTTATINEGVTRTEPGFSKKPIKLTPLQKFKQTKKQLHELGVGESSTTTSQPSESGSVLSELERKYLGAAA